VWSARTTWSAILEVRWHLPVVMAYPLNTWLLVSAWRRPAGRCTVECRPALAQRLSTSILSQMPRRICLLRYAIHHTFVFSIILNVRRMQEKYNLTLWHPCDFWRLGTLMLSPEHRAERQSAWMSNISRDSLIQSGTRCFMLYPYGTMGIKELNMIWWRLVLSDICYFLTLLYRMWQAYYCLTLSL